MRGFVIAIVVMLFALAFAQSSAHAQTIVRAHVNAIAAFDPNVVEEASVSDASASPRETPHESAVIDPADDRGAEIRARGPRGQPISLPKARSSDYFWCEEHAPAQALLGLDVPPPR